MSIPRLDSCISLIQKARELACQGAYGEYIETLRLALEKIPYIEAMIHSHDYHDLPNFYCRHTSRKLTHLVRMGQISADLVAIDHAIEMATNLKGILEIKQGEN